MNNLHYVNCYTLNLGAQPKSRVRDTIIIVIIRKINEFSINKFTDQLIAPKTGAK